jgi:SHOCT-like domain
MVLSEERLKILEMLQDGKINAEQAEGLLQALGEDKKEDRTASREEASFFGGGTRGKRWFRVRVTDTDSGKTRVNVRMPLGIMKAGFKMGRRFAPEIEDLDIEELMSLVDDDVEGQVVDVYDDDDGEHVEVFIE